MNFNETLIIALGILSSLLAYSKLTILTSIIFIILLLIGISITKNIALSISISAIVIYVFSMMFYIDTIESFKTKRNKTKRNKTKRNKSKRNKTHEKFSDMNNDEQEDFFDSPNSFIENYKSLTPNQIKTLNSDTQSLINTQKQLIETLNNMGPTLKQGKNVLDTFKNYFGKDADLGDILK